MSKSYQYSTYPTYFVGAMVFPVPYICPGPAISYMLYNNSNKQVTPPETKEQKLHKYASVGNVKKILKLVKSGGVDINAVNDDKETALHIASKHKQMQAIEALINLGIDINIKSKSNTLAKDLLNKAPDLQVQFESFVSNLRAHNIQTSSVVISKTINCNPKLPYFPKELVNIIAEYSVEPGPWIKSDVSIEEPVLLGESHNSNCCVIL